MMRLGASGGATQVAELHREKRRARTWAGGRDDVVEGAFRQLAHHDVVAHVRNRLGRIHVDLREGSWWHRRECVHRRADLAQRAQELRSLILATHEYGFDER